MAKNQGESIDIRGMEELVPWMTQLTDGLVVTKDSGLVATFELEGFDIDMVSEQNILNGINRINDVLISLGVAPYTAWFTVRKYKDDRYPEGSFPVWASRVVDEEHRENYLHNASYTIKIFFSLKLSPVMGFDRFMDRIQKMIGSGESFRDALITSFKSMINSNAAFAYDVKELRDVILDFEEHLSTIEARLADLGVRRLMGKDFIGFLRSFLDGDVRPDEAPEVIPRMFLDSGLPSLSVEVYEDVLEFDRGDRYCAALSIKDWPKYIQTGLFDTLLYEEAEMTFSIVFKVMSRKDSVAELEKRKKYLEMTQFGLKDYIKGAVSGSSDPAEVAEGSRAKGSDVAEINEMVSLIESDELLYGHMNVSLVIFGGSFEEVDSRARRMRRTLEAKLPGVIREKMHLLSAWAGTMPGNDRLIGRWVLMNTWNFADSAIITNVGEGEFYNDFLSEQTGKECKALTVLPTRYRTPYFFNFHRGALGHAMVLGPSRAGKSVFMNFLISQWHKYYPSRVVIFDKDKTCKVTTITHEGTYIDMGEEGAVKLNPFKLLLEKDSAKLSKNINFVISWLELICEVNGLEVDIDMRKEISEAVNSMVQQKSDEDLYTFSGFLPLVQDSDLEIVFSNYVSGGMYGGFFDNFEDEFSLDVGITAFEMGKIMQDKKISKVFIHYAFYMIQKIVEENRESGKDVIPTMIYLEESWFMFEDDIFAKKLKDWLKTFAKLTTNVVMTTQSLEDFETTDKSIMASLRDNMGCYVFLPNEKAVTDSARSAYVGVFGVKEEDLAIISTAQRNRDYLVVKGESSKLVSVRFTPAQLAFLRSEDWVVKILEEEVAKNASEWHMNYLTRVLEER